MIIYSVTEADDGTLECFVRSTGDGEHLVVVSMYPDSTHHEVSVTSHGQWCEAVPDWWDDEAELTALSVIDCHLDCMWGAQDSVGERVVSTIRAWREVRHGA